MQNTQRKNIPFSPPDISDAEINAVISVLKSGWITTGPKVAQFGKELQEYLGVNYALPLNSGTAPMELVYKIFGIGGEDEVIGTPYTYTATASSALHAGIRPKFVDVKKGSFNIDEQRLYDAITPKTKVIATVDIGGVPVDYDAVKDVVRAKGREDILLLSDSAHAFGASYKGRKVGNQFDFHTFSFHAVKNLTTAEGGALVFNNNSAFGKENLVKQFTVAAVHGQSKDALAKMQAGAWKYDVTIDGFKCNMSDIHAAVGLEQLRRYDVMLAKRKEIVALYDRILSGTDWAILPFRKDAIRETSYHLYMLRIKGFTEAQRDRLIQMLADEGIATNVHFIPLPMFTLYKNLGYKMEDYPHAYDQYSNEITLPLYSTLSVEDAEYVANQVVRFTDLIKRS